MQREPRPPHNENGHEHDTGNIEMLADMIDAASEIRRTHRSSVLLVSRQTHRSRFMRFPELDDDSLIKFWVQHIEEISHNEFIVRNLIADEEIRPLQYQQFFDIHAEASKLGIEQPANNHVVSQIFQIGEIDPSFIEDIYRSTDGIHHDMRRNELFVEPDNNSFSRIYSDVIWLKENLYKR